jgi:Domain of unknown function (DUF4365)
MRSINDEKSINEGKSVRFFEGVIEDNGWKYRRQEKDNDIDGEIEIFSKKRETTAKIIKVQLKATINLKYKEDKVVFDAPVKFLKFCDVCDIPTILVVYDVEQKRGFWIWTQHYLSQILDNFNPTWRDNTSKVTVHIPLINEVLEEERFYREIEQISHKGINEIQQLRKKDTSGYYYTILEEKDMSNAKKRISAKVYIERSFATSKDSMIELIKKINEKIKNNYYDKDVWKSKTNLATPDYIWIYFFDDLIQYEHGLPFCRSEWTNKDNPFLLLKNQDNLQQIQENIKVSWENSKTLDKFLLENQISKNDYLKEMLDTIFFSLEELKILEKDFREDKEGFYKRLTEKRNEYTSKYLLLSDVIPPYECKTLHRELNYALADIDNLAIEISNGQTNEGYISYNYISNFIHHMIIISNEIKKIR